MINDTDKGDDRGWDGWMASLTRWTWIWVNSGSWWWTGRSGVLQFMGLQRVGHGWVTELNWTDKLVLFVWKQWALTFISYHIQKLTKEEISMAKKHMNNCRHLYWLCACMFSCFSCVWPLATLWTVAHQTFSIHVILQARNNGVGFQAFLQGIFLSQGLNPYLLHLLPWESGSLPLVPPRKPL